MKLKFALVLATTAAFVLPQLAVADNENWSEEKAATVEQNRNTDSGLGNGGEREKKGGGCCRSTKNGELGGQDLDPGNSGAQDQGGKN